ncbi:MAG: hypothetical protein ABNH53_14125 [Henriciella sp.]|jgi:hypothetical protein
MPKNSFLVSNPAHVQRLVAFFGALMLGGPDSYLREVISEVGGNTDGGQYFYGIITGASGILFLTFASYSSYRIGKPGLKTLTFTESVFVSAGYVTLYIFIFVLCYKSIHGV